MVIRLVTYAMSGPVFQFSRVERAPINIRANAQGVYLWEDEKMDHGCQLPDSIDVKQHLQAFIQEFARESKDPGLHVPCHSSLRWFDLEEKIIMTEWCLF